MFLLSYEEISGGKGSSVQETHGTHCTQLRSFDGAPVKTGLTTACFAVPYCLAPPSHGTPVLLPKHLPKGG